MRRFPYVGIYGAAGDVPLAATCANVLILDAVTLLHTPGLIARILAFPRLRLIVQIHILDEVWRDEAGTFDWQQLHHIRAGLQAAGILERVLAILVDEECMLAAYAGPSSRLGHLPMCQHADPYDRINHCHRRWRDAVRRVKAVFPFLYIGAMETVWQDDPELVYQGQRLGPAFYRPTLPECDFLGVDAYVVGPLTRRAYEAQVEPVLVHADTFGKPLLIVGQAFSDDLRVMPTPEQMRWWVDTASLLSQAHAFAWFSLEGLARHQDRLVAAQWYAQAMDVADPVRGV